MAKGDRIAQLVLEKICLADIIETDVSCSLPTLVDGKLIIRTLMLLLGDQVDLGRLGDSEKLR